MKKRRKTLTAIINIRCTPQEKAFVVEQANSLGLTPSVLGRRRLRGMVVEAVAERNELRRLGLLLKQVRKESNDAYEKETTAILLLIKARLKALGA